MCQHLRIRDLGEFSQCEDCGLTTKKQTHQERIDRLEAMQARLEEIILHPKMAKKARELMNRIDAIRDKIELELTINRG